MVGRGGLDQGTQAAARLVQQTHVAPHDARFQRQGGVIHPQIQILSRIALNRRIHQPARLGQAVDIPGQPRRARL